MGEPSSEHVVLWAFRVRPGSAPEFERLYGQNGDWARLFERAEGFIGCGLWRDGEEDGRYVTVDRWRSRQDFDRFLATHRDEYAELDARGAQLTDSEVRLAELEPLPVPN